MVILNYENIYIGIIYVLLSDILIIIGYLLLLPAAVRILRRLYSFFIKHFKINEKLVLQVSLASTFSGILS